MDLWCVNNTVFFMRGLDKQYLEPIDRYAVHYPICWNTFLSLPVTLARTWQNWTVDQTKQSSLHTKICGNVILKKRHTGDRPLSFLFLFLFCMIYSYLCETLCCIDGASTKWKVGCFSLGFYILQGKYSIPVWGKMLVHTQTGSCENALFHMHLYTKTSYPTHAHTHTH